MYDPLTILDQMYIWLLVLYFFQDLQEVSRKSFLEILVQNGGTHKGSKLKRKQIGDERNSLEKALAWWAFLPTITYLLSGGEKGCSSGTTSQTDLESDLCGTERRQAHWQFSNQEMGLGGYADGRVGKSNCIRNSLISRFVEAKNVDMFAVSQNQEELV